MDGCQTQSQSGKTANDLSLDSVRLEYSVYPGQALVSAYFILRLYDRLQDAAKKTPQGYYDAEANSQIPGSGGVASNAIHCLRNYQKYKDLHILLAELHYEWVRLTGPKSGNFEKNFQEGLTKSLRLEQDFINLVREKNKFFEVS